VIVQNPTSRVMGNAMRFKSGVQVNNVLVNTLKGPASLVRAQEIRYQEFFLYCVQIYRGSSLMVEKKDSKFESSQIISMFPTFVWQTMIKEEIYQTINKDILKKLNELTQSIPKFTPGRSCNRIKICMN